MDKMPTTVYKENNSRYLNMTPGKHNNTLDNM